MDLDRDLASILIISYFALLVAISVFVPVVIPIAVVPVAVAFVVLPVAVPVVVVLLVGVFVSAPAVALVVFFPLDVLFEQVLVFSLAPAALFSFAQIHPVVSGSSYFSFLTTRIIEIPNTYSAWNENLTAFPQLSHIVIGFYSR